MFQCCPFGVFVRAALFGVVELVCLCGLIILKRVFSVVQSFVFGLQVFWCVVQPQVPAARVLALSWEA